MDKQNVLQHHSLAGKHIIVAGAGIAGVAFVRGLTHSWPSQLQRPSIAVYERDPRKLPADRGNYSLGLRSDSKSGGLQALQRLGLIDEVYAARVPSSEAGFLIRDAQWDTILKVRKQSSAPPNGLPTANMRITRNSLRECLIQGVPDDTTMHWGIGCNSAAVLKDGRVEVGLSDGTTEEADLLIVADGAGSKIRGSLRPDDGLRYAGAVAIGGNANFADGELPDNLREGFGMILGGNSRALIMFPIDDNSCVWFVTRRSPTPGTAVSGSRAVEKKDDIIAEALKEGGIFGKPLPAVVAATDPTTLRIFNAQDKEPVNHSETPGLPYIFIGDANHAMR
jgi:2-polyprenyl-6-methoxyphenol hydroxylase-like FAD-dependent oxidoreductase